MVMANEPDNNPWPSLDGATPRYRRGSQRPARLPSLLPSRLRLALLLLAAVGVAGCGPLRGVLPSGTHGPRTLRVADAVSLDRAARTARPGDTVLVAAGTYDGTLELHVSGTPAAPIRFVAAPGATIDAAGGPAGISVTNKHDLEFSGFTVTGATAQGVWVGDAAARLHFSRLRVTRNQGPGFQIKDAAGVTVERSVVDGNLRAGIMELDGVRGGRYYADVISGNGHDHLPFNGDGILLHGQGTVVSGCRLSGNGDDQLHEHGIYVGSDATSYLLENNELSGNSGAGIKAEGAGTVRGNRFGSSRLAIAADESSGDGILLQGNTITGSFQHAVCSLSRGLRPRASPGRGGAAPQSPGRGRGWPPGWCGSPSGCR